MNCQRYKPAKFQYVTPVGTQKEKIFKGVPQVDMAMLEVSETYHAPPANAVSYDMLVKYPPEESPVPDTTPRFYHSLQSGEVKPSNFVCKYQRVDGITSKKAVESVKQPGQRMLG
jgi:hypothetical protein